jgi:hypothetical protein
MHAVAGILGKPVQVTWTAAAENAMQSLGSPLIAEMELYFSCLIRKRVRFNELAKGDDTVKVNEHLLVCFRPVMSKSCAMDPEGSPPPLTDLPIVNPAAFVPKWMTIDFRNGGWVGEFGLA